MVFTLSRSAEIQEVVFEIMRKITKNFKDKISLTKRRKKEIEKFVKKFVKEYGETLKLLGRE